MTVCVAAIARHGAIIFAADRMLSTDFRKYEPEASKILMFPNRTTFLLWAGDTALQAELLQELALIARSHASGAPLISSIVEAYQEAYGRAFDRRMERRILRRHNVALADYRAGKHRLDVATVKRIDRRIDDFQLREAVAVIIAGLDALGPHVWVVENDEPSCRDIEGFAAIGTGADAAVDFLRAAQYSPARTQCETLLLTYAAKKRGEGSPTVGARTDVASLVGLGAGGSVGSQVRQNLEAAYQVLLAGEQSALRTALDTLDASMQTLMQEEGIQPALSTPPSPADTPAPAAPLASTDGP